MKEEKKNCIPDGLVISHDKFSVPLQSLLDHTVKRMFLVMKEPELFEVDLTMDFKCGFDGTNVNLFRQKTEDKNFEYKQVFS